MAELDVLTLSLTDRRLIEASAGTGKTYAIGSLFLRAVLGHGCAPLPVASILVVTFTNAATLELRARLRRRLVDALAAYDGALCEPPAPAPEDPLLVALLDEGPAHETGAALLRAALASLDEAAVYTIHGFCQRILVERAFDSGAPFEQAFVLDDGPYREQAARDFWRRRVYPLPADAAALIRAQWPGPDALLASVRSHLGRPDLVLRGVGSGPFEDRLAAARGALGALQMLWREGDLRARIERSCVGKAQATGGHRAALDAMDRWASAATSFSCEDADGRGIGVADLLERYTPAKLLAKLLKRGEPPAFDDLFAAVDAALAALGDALARVRADALMAIRRDAEAAKRSEAVISPDDVLLRTEQGLRGARGPAFARAVRRAFPVAFIDEFQDTDPVQYRIFDLLYPAGGSDDDAPGALVMIGDAKQAIYGFRGADVYAYLGARSQLAPDARADMHVNWRSTPELLEALEALYTRSASPFLVDGIDFVRVAARPGASRGSLHDCRGALPALTLWHLPDLEGTQGTTRAHYQASLTEHLVQRLVQLLDSQVQVAGGPLAAGQIAVLVRDHFEAEAVHGALARAGIASVRQSRRTVFSAPQARDLLFILRAALEPRNESAVRTALATPLLDLPLDALHAALHEDEALWQMHLDRFAHYHALWQRQGPMVLLRRLLSDYDVPQRLLRSADGARALTDLRHLGELLQRAVATSGSLHQQTRWFARQLSEAEDADASRMRLETDEDLVRIVTMHAAKGLEYEVVMVPFACWLRVGDDATYHERASEDTSAPWQAVLDLDPDEQALARTDEERLAEDLRLLYVALTRARSACFVGVTNFAPGRGGSRLTATALGRLLCSVDGDAPRRAAVTAAGRAVEDAVEDAVEEGADEAEDAAGLLTRCLQTLAERSAHVAVELVTDGAADEAAAPPTLPPVAQRSTFTGRIRDDWRMTSYSALVDVPDAQGAGRPGAGDEDHTLRLPELDVLADDGAVQAPWDVADRFPRGARPGSCLHALLEDWPTDEGEAPGHVAQTLAAWGFEDAPGAPAASVCDWLRAVRSAPLPFGASLARAQRAVPELEFHLPLANVDLTALRALLAEYGYEDGPLALSRVRGMMRGFIDLIVEHDGRFWIVDYKSNWLGPAVANYAPAAVAASVREHRYDLQYLIYCVALRRLLRARLGADGPQRLAGALYLYLRGLDGSGHGVHRDEPSPQLLEAMDELFAGRAP